MMGRKEADGMYSILCGTGFVGSEEKELDKLEEPDLDPRSDSRFSYLRMIIKSKREETNEMILLLYESLFYQMS